MGMLAKISSEWAYLSGALRTLKRIKNIPKTPNITFPDVVEDLADQYGDRVALISDTETYSYRQYTQRANQYARWVQANGVKKGETVALMMNNCAEYLVIWLGVTRAGGVCALLNTNLGGAGLGHCINLVEPKHIIVGADLVDTLETAGPLLEGEPKIWVYGSNQLDYEELGPAVEALSDAPLSADENPGLVIDDQALYIYTSGTTGLPKAANINHYRLRSIMNGFSAAMNAKITDRIYVCLPLYHSSGGVLAVGATLTVGGSVAIRNGFSAREFWDDIVRFDATLFQYIGELCRYLLNSPTNPNETAHKIRLCCGNGLRPDIWMDFKTRFRLPHILEFYGATEGNVVLFNFDSKPGSVGRIPNWLKKKFVTEVVKFDVENERPVRGEDGFCILCEPDEVGEVIGQILDDPERPSQRFEGYADDEATAKKILHDVFEKGDLWFRTGDLMRRDADGYFYFIDRIGDTFRWKGENVATSEVAEAITVFPGIKDANVYGVEVSGRDGRAGMAALVVEEDIDLVALHRHLAGQLPDYAQPVFLRLQKELEITGTFKQKKVDLVKEGFDPEAIADEIYFDDPESGAFQRVDRTLYDHIQDGGVRI